MEHRVWGTEVSYLLCSGAFHDILADIIFFREAEKFVDAASSLETQAMKQSGISESKNIFLLFFIFIFHNNQIDLAYAVHPLSRYVLASWDPPGLLQEYPLPSRCMGL